MTQMKVITKENLETMFPNNIDYNLETMDKETLDAFLNLYSYTQTLLNVCISEMLGVKRYDSYLEYNSLHFQQTKEEDMDIYQYIGSSVMKYLYVRNNLYLERLTEEERRFLIDKMLKNDFSIDEETKKILESILAKAIVEIKKTSGELELTNFGPELPEYFAPMNALVIGLRYDEFYEGDLSDEDWDVQYERQKEEIAKLISQLTNELSAKINIPVKVIPYNEFSIKKNQVNGRKQ